MSEAKRRILLVSARKAFREKNVGALRLAAGARAALPGRAPRWAGPAFRGELRSPELFRLRPREQKRGLRVLLLHLVHRVSLPADLAAQIINRV